MKISKKTIEILRNFATINDSLLFNVGTKQRIAAINRRFVADAVIEDIPVSFGIFKLSQLLGILSLFKEPDVEFGDKGLTIREDNRELFYRYTHQSLIKGVPSIPIDKDMVLPSVDVQFDLSAETLSALEKSARMLESDQFIISGDGENLTLRTFKPDDQHAAHASFNIDKTTETFRLVGTFRTLLIMPGNYTVKLSRARAGKFINKDVEVIYTYAFDDESTFS